MPDFGKPCTSTESCTYHNLHCGYPKCAKGEAEAQARPSQPVTATVEGLRTGTIHDLKVWPEFFEPLSSGEKSFELRLDDRGFRAGDTLLLREWSKADGYSGRQIERVVTYIAGGEPWLSPNYVCMGLAASLPPAAVEPDRLMAAITWALGVGDSFRERNYDEGAYWWRKELAERAGIKWDGTKYIPSPD